MFYHLIIMLIAATSVILGFRKGFARQIPSMTGMAFGIVSARLLAPGLEDVLYGAFPMVHGRVHEQFVYDTVSSSLVFGAVYAVFRTITGFLGKVLRRDDRTILDNIGGSVYGLFKWMLFVSVALNLIVASKLSKTLLHTVKSDDGNTAEEVMLLSPALLGGEDVVELSHKIQLEEAKKIS